MKKIALKPSVINIEEIVEANQDNDAFVIHGPNNSLIAIHKTKIASASRTVNFIGECIFEGEHQLTWGYNMPGISSDNEFYVNNDGCNFSSFRFRVTEDSALVIEKSIKDFLNPPEKVEQPDWQLVTFQETE